MLFGIVSLVKGLREDVKNFETQYSKVDAVEEDSPAMTAGVQNADIVHALNGKEISSMNRYSAILQSLVKGSRVKLEVYRKNPYGTYVNVELNVLIKEK